MATTTRSGLITLLTDFGTQDHFVGVMKGVIAGIAPAARVVDITHEVGAHQVGQGRFLLGQSWPYFPKGTVHVCVVDPGVGTARRPIVVEAGGHLFVGPDNGILTDLLAVKGAKTRALTQAKWHLKNVSQTFHGRDIFAPAAAHLAKGAKVSEAGRLIEDALRLSSGVPQRTGRRFWNGEVAHVDHFGNLITNLAAAEFLPLAVKGLALKVGLTEVGKLVGSYAEAAEGEVVLITGSSGNLEVAMNQGSAARKLGVGLGSPVELEVW
ncbi:MAG: SAM-dependent chlorinase/fluorinase [Bryobacterales bacterium]|nr:SAM-dependent chlorinase/fluorinase [Bryobacterales bacterium]